MKKGKIKNSPENLIACSCANCPSYNDCAREKRELLFCSEEVGPGTCVYEMNGCVCGPCAVYQKYNLDSGYYCRPK